uniref:Glycoside hydrolase family 65 C-terminal domain-containing protein n=1 Tax=Alexandrium andersonii TaxID=327968 RepID=A0A7S2I3Z8_9DINO
MTWSMFAIGWFSVGNYQRSVPHFLKGFHNAQPPFGVWTEYPAGAKDFPGCVNFVTGAGGFLQSLVFGTSGMRMRRDGLHFDPPPPSATGTAARRLVLHSFHYLGWRLRQEVTEASATYELLGGSGPQLCLEVPGTEPRELQPGGRASGPRGRSSIRVCQGAARPALQRRLSGQSAEVLV